MTSDTIFDELQGQTLRAIARNSVASPGAWTLTKKQPNKVELLQDTAAKLFASENGWQYRPGFDWGHFDALAPDTAHEILEYYMVEPLLFVNRRESPVAFATQPRRQGDFALDELSAAMSRAGLAVSKTPSAYASIASPGERHFIVCTRKRTPVRWLPEQQECDGPFALYENEAPHFHDFLEQFEAPQSRCADTIHRLKFLRGRGRRWVPPKQIFSLRHLQAYLYGCSATPSSDYAMAPLIWKMFEAWRGEQTSLTLSFDREVGA